MTPAEIKTAAQQAYANGLPMSASWPGCPLGAAVLTVAGRTAQGAVDAAQVLGVSLGWTQGAAEGWHTRKPCPQPAGEFGDGWRWGREW